MLSRVHRVGPQGCYPCEDRASWPLDKKVLEKSGSPSRLHRVALTSEPQAKLRAWWRVASWQFLNECIEGGTKSVFVTFLVTGTKYRTFTALKNEGLFYLVLQYRVTSCRGPSKTEEPVKMRAESEADRKQRGAGRDVDPSGPLFQDQTPPPNNEAAVGSQTQSLSKSPAYGLMRLGGGHFTRFGRAVAHGSAA